MAKPFTYLLLKSDGSDLTLKKGVGMVVLKVVGKKVVVIAITFQVWLGNYRKDTSLKFPLLKR
jgi:hypothetical protein